MTALNDKKTRVLDIFYRAFRGESISIKNLSNEYNVTTKSISRDINEIKIFLAENRDLVGNTELEYSYKEKAYKLHFDGFLLSKELIAVAKILVGSRAFKQEDLAEIISKLKQFTSYHDRKMMETQLSNELYHYSEVGSDCDSVIDNIWLLTKAIYEKKEVSIIYIKMNRKEVIHRIRPLAISFSENYFYLFAGDSDEEKPFPLYFRVDRIKNITVHRDKVMKSEERQFDEGDLRKRIQYMFPGKEMVIRFEFTGPSVQAILDRMPTARIINKLNGTYLIEAVVYGDGIKMYLLSQGSWIKVISPPEFVDKMREEIDKLHEMYYS